MILNMESCGSRKSQIIVLAPAGSEISCYSGAVYRPAVEMDGMWIFKGCGIGTWTVTAKLEGKAETRVIDITEADQRMRYHVQIGYQLYAADFDWASFGTLGTDYEILYDDDTPIPESDWATAKTWKARILVSRKLKCLADGTIDVFAVGGSAPALRFSADDYNVRYSPGGDVQISRNVRVSVSEYDIAIGSGGVKGASQATSTPGGDTSAFGVTASGGACEAGASAFVNTHEFEEDTYSRTYGGSWDTKNATPDSNTGKGPFVDRANHADSASGIVIIRNAREENSI